jgi:hypothetical protein
MSTTRADFTGFPSDAVTTRPVTAQGADAWSRPSLLSEGTGLWASRVAVITRREGMNRKRRIGTSCFVELQSKIIACQVFAPLPQRGVEERLRVVEKSLFHSLTSLRQSSMSANACPQQL